MLEPIGPVIPKLTSGDSSRDLLAKESEVLTMQCPMQAFPVPKFR